MKIAMLAPIEEAVPPKKYGGIETVVYNLAQELHRMGHDVTVFASGDSELDCTLVPLVDKAIGSGISKRFREAMTYKSLVTAAQIIAKGDYDIVHNHVGWQALLFKDIFKKPIVTTIHWTLDNECEREMYKIYRETPFVSISNDQRKHAPELNYVATIYHGLSTKLFKYNDKPKDYLAFLGRFSPVKGPVEAISVAEATGEKLVMAGKINKFEQKYFDEKIRPHIDGQKITFIGELDRLGTIELLKNAKALLSLIQWDEPFGLTNIEAMACGTPVIGIKRGSLPEIIIDKETGFLCEDVQGAIEAVGRIDQIDRKFCRSHIQNNFSNDRVAKDYLSVYQDILSIAKLSINIDESNEKLIKKMDKTFRAL